MVNSTKRKGSGRRSPAAHIGTRHVIGANPRNHPLPDSVTGNDKAIRERLIDLGPLGTGIENCPGQCLAGATTTPRRERRTLAEE